MKKFGFGVLILGTLMSLAAPVTGLAADRDNGRGNNTYQRVETTRGRNDRSEFRERDRNDNRDRNVRYRDYQTGYYDQYGNWCQR